MKRLLFAVFAMLLVLPVVYAEVSVQRQMPSTAEYNQTISVSLQLNSNSSFDMAELLPQGWVVVSWSVLGNTTPVILEHKDLEYQNRMVTGYHWIFNQAGQFTLSYVASAASSGNHIISNLATYPGGFNSADSKIFITPVCGNDICESAVGENAITCSNDCRPVRLSLLWVIILILATFITIAGIAYREYLMYWLKKPVKIRILRKQHKK